MKWQHSFWVWCAGLLLMVSLIQCNGVASFNAIEEQKQITALLYAQRDAWNKGDMEGYMNGYLNDDSLMFIGKRGITRGWNQTLNNYLKSYPEKSAMGQLAFELLHIDIITAQDAYVIGKWELKREIEPHILSGHYTLRLKKIDGLWKIISDHSS